jgi:hypothetical protein
VSRFYLFFAAFVVGIWITVPIHELLHAAACLITGGSVFEVQIHPLFGGGLLERWIPWVTAGWGEAGRLAGFRPAGDLGYLLTVLAPHLVLAPVGAWICRRAVGRNDVLIFGLGAAAALQPLASLTGDMVEAVGIPVTRIAAWAGWPEALTLRVDSFGRLAEAATMLGGPAAWFLATTLLMLGAIAASTILGFSGGIAPRKAQPAAE